MDYASGPYTVMFSANMMRMSFDISINDDQIFEPNENFFLAINTSTLPVGFFAVDPSEAIVTIVDDDGKIFL